MKSVYIELQEIHPMYKTLDDAYTKETVINVLEIDYCVFGRWYQGDVHYMFELRSVI